MYKDKQGTVHNMRHITLKEALMIRVASLGKKQYKVMLGDWPSFYETVEEGSRNG